MVKVAYIRVSSVDQSFEKQKQLMADLEIEKYFEEKVSAKDVHRPQLQNLLSFVREGDVLYLESFSRLARSTRDLYSLMDIFEEKKVNVISLKEITLISKTL
jgi:DNA invertase Pin-like site-specific DNA recombinase